ncbi:PAS domain-containing protein [Agrobacterium vitis]|uniref:PAS domain-containing protein n=1 Tax=Agrobacterium vitis TaxID=373 RepID=UPI001F2A2FF6|nr:PAS domain-containing protein [Agrobacterium vitis]
MFGYTEMEAFGQPIYLIVPDDKRDEEAELLRRLTLGERVETFETTRRHLDHHLADQKPGMGTGRRIEHRPGRYTDERKASGGFTC